MRMPRVMRRRLTAFVADVVAILLFVLIGRRVHDHGVSVTGLATTFWPFGAGLIGGWLLAIRRRMHVVTLRAGGAIVLVTVVIGMLLRLLADQGTASGAGAVGGGMGSDVTGTGTADTAGFGGAGSLGSSGATV